ncbi:MAG: response regulator transcription factor, partial [Bacteroidota bacterium]
MKTIQIMLVDDHEIVRDGLCALLLGNPRIQLVGEASNAPDFFQLIKKEPPDVAILDIALPGMSGIDIARQLQQEHST